MRATKTSSGVWSVRVCGLVVFGLVVATGLLGVCEGAGQGKDTPQKSFATPEKAVEALGVAYQKGDRQTMAAILGDTGWRLVFSGDPVIDRYERAWFLSLYREGHEVDPESESRAVLTLGKDGQPYPIPIVKTGAHWRFDSSEGHEDLLSRRMSKNELSALNVVVAFVAAQRAYHQAPQRGDGVKEYAQKFKSTPGQHDGLYWEEPVGQAAGPLAGLADLAGKEGYRPAQAGEPRIYRGYLYKPLTAQGPQAPGGARDYVVNGRMTAGFALVAFPIRYGISGVLTFLVNQDGVVYQKDLGPKTVEVGRSMTRFDPDSTWTKGQAN